MRGSLARLAAGWHRLAGKETPEVSVIIPTYNCASYLARAVDSALDQRAVEVEVVIVDDGSTDGTPSLLAERYGANRAVRVFRHAENCNQGAARNTGLDAARGVYVFFLDADDWLDPGALARLTELAAGSPAEIVACGVRLAYIDGRSEPFHAHAFECAGGRDALGELIAYRIGSIVWNKLYRREFLDRHQLRFVDSLGKEDVIFSIEAVWACSHFLSTDEVFCNYLQRDDGCILGPPTVRHLESFVRLYVDMIRFVERAGLDADSEGVELARGLFRAHGSADLYPKLVAYVRSRPEEQWEEECWRVCRAQLGAAGYAVADVLARTMREAQPQRHPRSGSA